MIYIVSGLGRCGSSMMMQALVAGGMDPGKALGPMFEDERQTKNPTGRWVEEYNGKILKWLSPLEYPPPDGIMPLWLSRNPKQQAQSWCKFQRKVLGLGSQRSKRGAYAARIKRETEPSIQLLLRKAPLVHCMLYERMLLDPISSLAGLAEAWGVKLNLEKAAAVVLRRSPKCAPTMLEGALMKRYVRKGG